MNNQKCADRINESWDFRRSEIKELFDNNDYDGLYEYALCYDYVEANTFTDQEEGYFRYQISWGGPQEELRIFENGTIEFWFLDWVDGECIDVSNDEIAKEIKFHFEDFNQGLIEAL